MTDTNRVNAYLRTKVMTASPEELRLLLIDGAIRFANQARRGLNDRDHELAYAGFTQCRTIVLELLGTIRQEHAPELAARVRSLYAFIYSELVTCSLERDADRLGTVIELLEYERETWVMLMDQLAKERGQAAEPKPEGADGPAPLSVQA